MAGAVWALVFVVLFVVGVWWWSTLSDERKDEIRQEQKNRTSAKRDKRAGAGKVGLRQPISTAGKMGPAGLACPRCGSTQFTAKRSMKGKLAAGVLAPKTQVRCVACGAMYKRG